MKMVKKTLCTVLSLIMLFSVIFCIPASADDFENTLNSFPMSYRDSLIFLHSLHPNWNFRAKNINLKVSEVANKELGKKLISKSNTYLRSYPELTDYWAYTNINYQYSGWTTLEPNYYYATANALNFYLSPQNFLNEKDIFMFLVQNAGDISASNQAVDNMLYNYPSLFEQREAIKSAALSLGLNPTVIAANIIQEQGNAESLMVKGYPDPQTGVLYYNFFNAGAYGSTKDEIYLNGFNYAKSQGWDTPEKSIIGGSAKFANEYINMGQYTFFYIDFNILNLDRLYHQYAANIDDARAKGSKLSEGYAASPDISITFELPVYLEDESYSGGFECINTVKVENHNGIYYYAENGVIRFDVSGLKFVDGNWYKIENGTVKNMSHNTQKDIWYYERDGGIDYSYTGFANWDNTGGCFYLKNGVLDFDVNGLVLVDGIYYYIQNGKLSTENTLYKDEYGVWYYIQNGMINWESYPTLVNYNDSWWYTENGILNWDYTGPVYYNDWWYYVEEGYLNWNSAPTLTLYRDYWYYAEKGSINWNYTGLFNFLGIDYYIQDGALNWEIYELKEINGVWYYLQNSMVDYSYTGLTSYCGGWYFVENGVINWESAPTLTNYNGGWYYAENGVVGWDYTGTFKYGNTEYFIQNGYLYFGIDGLTLCGGEWCLLQNSAVNSDYTGLINYCGGWYYVENGKIDWESNPTLTYYGGSWYFTEKGILNWDYTGIVNYGGDLYYVQNGFLNWNSEPTLSLYNDVWYYVKNGAADYSYTGLICYFGTWYYVQNGKINWNSEPTLTNYYGNWYYVRNGILDWNYTGYVYYGGWNYYITNGFLDWSKQ